MGSVKNWGSSIYSKGSAAYIKDFAKTLKFVTEEMKKASKAIRKYKVKKETLRRSKRLAAQERKKTLKKSKSKTKVKPKKSEPVMLSEEVVSTIQEKESKKEENNKRPNFLHFPEITIDFDLKDKKKYKKSLKKIEKEKEEAKKKKMEEEDSETEEKEEVEEKKETEKVEESDSEEKEEKEEVEESDEEEEEEEEEEELNFKKMDIPIPRGEGVTLSESYVGKDVFIFAENADFVFVQHDTVDYSKIDESWADQIALIKYKTRIPVSVIELSKPEFKGRFYAPIKYTPKRGNHPVNRKKALNRVNDLPLSKEIKDNFRDLLFETNRQTRRLYEFGIRAKHQKKLLEKKIKAMEKVWKKVKGKSKTDEIYQKTFMEETEGSEAPFFDFTRWLNATMEAMKQTTGGGKKNTEKEWFILKTTILYAVETSNNENEKHVVAIVNYPNGDFDTRVIRKEKHGEVFVWKPSGSTGDYPAWRGWYGGHSKTKTLEDSKNAAKIFGFKVLDGKRELPVRVITTGEINNTIFENDKYKPPDEMVEKIKNIYENRDIDDDIREDYEEMVREVEENEKKEEQLNEVITPDMVPEETEKDSIEFEEEDNELEDVEEEDTGAEESKEKRISEAYIGGIDKYFIVPSKKGTKLYKLFRNAEILKKFILKLLKLRIKLIEKYPDIRDNYEELMALCKDYVTVRKKKYPSIPDRSDIRELRNIFVNLKYIVNGTRRFLHDKKGSSTTFKMLRGGKKIKHRSIKKNKKVVYMVGKTKRRKRRRRKTQKRRGRKLRLRRKTSKARGIILTRIRSITRRNRN